MREHPIFSKKKSFEESIFSGGKITQEHQFFRVEKSHRSSKFSYLRPLREDARRTLRRD